MLGITAVTLEALLAGTKTPPNPGLPPHGLPNIQGRTAVPPAAGLLVSTAAESIRGGPPSNIATQQRWETGTFKQRNTEEFQRRSIWTSKRCNIQRLQRRTVQGSSSPYAATLQRPTPPQFPPPCCGTLVRSNIPTAGPRKTKTSEERKVGKHPRPPVPGGNAPASRGATPHRQGIATQTPEVDSRIVSTREK